MSQASTLSEREEPKRDGTTTTMTIKTDGISENSKYNVLHKLYLSKQMSALKTEEEKKGNMCIY